MKNDLDSLLKDLNAINDPKMISDEEFAKAASEINEKMSNFRIKCARDRGRAEALARDAWVC